MVARMQAMMQTTVQVDPEPGNGRMIVAACAGPGRVHGTLRAEQGSA